MGSISIFVKEGIFNNLSSALWVSGPFCATCLDYYSLIAAQYLGIWFLQIYNVSPDLFGYGFFCPFIKF